MTSRTSVFPWPFIGVKEHDAIVYTLWTALDAAFVPMYVGETARGVSRLAEHVGASKLNNGEYTIRKAAEYLESTGHPTMFLVIEVPAKDKVKVQNDLIAKFKRMDYQLLNGPKVFAAKDMVEENAVLKIHRRVDEILAAAAEAGAKTAATVAPTNGSRPKKKLVVPRKMATCHPDRRTWTKDGLCTQDHMLAVQAKKHQEGAVA